MENAAKTGASVNLRTTLQNFSIFFSIPPPYDGITTFLNILSKTNFVFFAFISSGFQNYYIHLRLFCQWFYKNILSIF